MLRPLAAAALAAALLLAGCGGDDTTAATTGTVGTPTATAAPETPEPSAASSAACDVLAAGVAELVEGTAFGPPAGQEGGGCAVQSRDERQSVEVFEQQDGGSVEDVAATAEASKIPAEPVEGLGDRAIVLRTDLSAPGRPVVSSAVHWERGGRRFQLAYVGPRDTQRIAIELAKRFDETL